jgi:L-aspartate oxidase
MGGIVADLHAHSTLPGLYAVGEASCTGLHGANRLASNSLSECFVFARRAISHALAEPAPHARKAASVAELAELAALPAPPAGDLTAREALWRDAGIVRSAEGIARLLESPHPLVRAIAECALTREESRGAHQRTDHPERDPALDLHHVVLRSATREDRAALAHEWQIWD